MTVIPSTRMQSSRASFWSYGLERTKPLQAARAMVLKRLRNLKSVLKQPCRMTSGV
ncbi:DUF1868 domain-containing protein [Salmonella enterica]|nr:DUF1868 domain-containing protein [Salmonella enterica subsp. enterica]EGJ4670207.1 DUF1868 domain-containing protein [Salmonella enterica]EHU7519178.1 DUF1868 domain-containing protein [Salmonella enterica]EHW1663110.1 DUF1868 domain-containing protein [Salmonella enterica]MIL26351.1 DUF1868 domain-containing protein [Salmonella enterica]